MKKGMLFVLGFVLLAGVLPAHAFKTEAYTQQQLRAKVENMELLSPAKMPTPFVYTVKTSLYNNQPDINTFYKAKELWERNPRNFAAAFNYGLLIMSNDFGEGLALNETQLDEAYRVLEAAKKLRPEYTATYFLQEELLNLKIFGASWFSPVLGQKELLAGYRQHQDLTRKQLALLKTAFKQKGAFVPAAQYEQAALLCQALNRQQEAQVYQAKARQAQKEVRDQVTAILQRTLKTSLGNLCDICAEK